MVGVGWSGSDLANALHIKGMTHVGWSIEGLWVALLLQKSSLEGLAGSCRMPACRARTDTFSNRPDMRIMLPTGAMTGPFFRRRMENGEGAGGAWILKEPASDSYGSKKKAPKIDP